MRGTDAAVSAWVYSSCPYYLHEGNIVSTGTSGKWHPYGIPSSNANMVDSSTFSRVGGEA